jgi:hypothetical protein
MVAAFHHCTVNGLISDLIPCPYCRLDIARVTNVTRDAVTVDLHPQRHCDDPAHMSAPSPSTGTRPKTIKIIGENGREYEWQNWGLPSGMRIELP